MRVLVLGVMLTMGMAATAWAVPPQINAQGVLKDAGGVPLEDGALEVTFRLYDDQAKTTLLWSELQTIDLFGGVFNTLLPEDPINADLSPAAKAVIAAGGELWLTIEPDGQAETDPVPLVSVPYAWTAGSALIANDLACSGCIDASNIASGALAATVLDYDDTNAGLGASTVQGAIDMLAALVDDLALQVARPTTVGTTGGNLTIGNVAYQWPATAGTNGQVLTYNASGGLSWQSPSSGGAGTLMYIDSRPGVSLASCPSGWSELETRVVNVADADPNPFGRFGYNNRRVCYHTSQCAVWHREKRPDANGGVDINCPGGWNQAHGPAEVEAGASNLNYVTVCWRCP